MAGLVEVLHESKGMRPWRRRARRLRRVSGHPLRPGALGVLLIASCLSLRRGFGAGRAGDRTRLAASGGGQVHLVDLNPVLVFFVLRFSPDHLITRDSDFHEGAALRLCRGCPRHDRSHGAYC